MSVTRVVFVVTWIVGALAGAPSAVSAQETTFIALGSDPDEVVGHGSDTYLRCHDGGFHSSTAPAGYTGSSSRSSSGRRTAARCGRWDSAPRNTRLRSWEPGTMRQRRRDTLRRGSTSPLRECHAGEEWASSSFVSCGSRFLHTRVLRATIDFDARCAGAQRRLVRSGPDLFISHGDRRGRPRDVGAVASRAGHSASLRRRD